LTNQTGSQSSLFWDCPQLGLERTYLVVWPTVLMGIQLGVSPHHLTARQSTIRPQWSELNARG